MRSPAQWSEDIGASIECEFCVGGRAATLGARHASMKRRCAISLLVADGRRSERFEQCQALEVSLGHGVAFAEIERIGSKADH
jgi:hypothetical protein